jgi:hypothetical protein
MPAAEVTAAIISAIATGASVAAGEVSKSVRTAGGNAIGLTITNESDIDFDVRAYSPNHGHFIQSPGVTLPGYFHEYDKFMAAAKAKYGPDPDESELDAELTKWSGNDLFETYAKGTTIKAEGTGAGMGFETAFLLEATEGHKFQLAVLMRKIPGGSYGIGIGVANYDFYPGKGNNKYGSSIIEHIKKIHTSRCQYSDGGGSISVSLSGKTVTAAAPGEVNGIVIKDS